jgi:uncharacterized protein (DUF2141 family)
MSRKPLILILCILFFSTILVAQENTGILEITFRGIRNEDGLIAIGINRSDKGWPYEPDMDFNWPKSGMQEGKLTVRLDFPYGTYAISVLDDENSNLGMEYFLGIPREGFGFSCNPRIGMKTPKFEECSFRVDRPFVHISIDVRYMGRK